MNMLLSAITPNHALITYPHITISRDRTNPQNTSQSCRFMSSLFNLCFERPHTCTPKGSIWTNKLLTDGINILQWKYIFTPQLKRYATKTGWYISFQPLFDTKKSCVIRLKSIRSIPTVWQMAPQLSGRNIYEVVSYQNKNYFKSRFSRTTLIKKSNIEK